MKREIASNRIIEVGDNCTTQTFSSSSSTWPTIMAYIFRFSIFQPTKKSSLVVPNLVTWFNGKTKQIRDAKCSSCVSQFPPNQRRRKTIFLIAYCIVQLKQMNGHQLARNTRSFIIIISPASIITIGTQ